MIVDWNYNKIHNYYVLSVFLNIVPKNDKILFIFTEKTSWYVHKWSYDISHTVENSHILSVLSSEADTNSFESDDQATSDIPCLENIMWTVSLANK